jgi:hypothetical protein
LSKIKDLGLDAISEDEFLDLIAYREAGGGELDETQKKKLEKEREEMENQAAAMAKREKEEEALRQRKAKVLSKEGVATRSVRQTKCAFPMFLRRLISRLRCAPQEDLRSQFAIVDYQIRSRKAHRNLWQQGASPAPW